MNWITTFNEKDNQMIHEMPNGVQVITDFNFATTIVCRDGQRINSFQTASLADIEDYTKFLRNTHAQAEAINQ